MVLEDGSEIASRVRRAADNKVLFLPHALRQMLRPERMISRAEVRRVIAEGTIIEDYPDDARGHSCLILGASDGERPIHVACSPRDDYLAVITAYLPDEYRWSNGFSVRIEK
jgi:hypothetical protein